MTFTAGTSQPFAFPEAVAPALPLLGAGLSTTILSRPIPSSPIGTGWRSPTSSAAPALLGGAVRDATVPKPSPGMVGHVLPFPPAHRAALYPQQKMRRRPGADGCLPPPLGAEGRGLCTCVCPRAGGLGAVAVTASWHLSQLLARANNTLFNPVRAAFPNLPAEIHEP